MVAAAIVPRVIGDKFISYAQNREDVVLWRALGSVPDGRYVEIGANDPEHFSITKAFYDRGWRGLAVEPMPSFAAALREARPEDVVVEAAVGDEDGSITLHAIEDSGLSTVLDDVSSGHEADGRVVQDLEVRSMRLDTLLREHGFDSVPVHFLVVDVEGAERAVLSGVDFRAWRPWVVVVEATAPLSTERTHGSWEHLLVDAGYEFTLFDGLSRFYVAEEHAEELRHLLDNPANVLDSYVDLLGDEWKADEIRRLREDNELLVARTQFWREQSLVAWATGAARVPGIPHAEHDDVLRRLHLAEREVARLKKKLKATRRAPDGRQPAAAPAGVLDKLRRAAGRRA